MIRQRVESVFWTLKDRLGLERHRAKLLALAAGVWVNGLVGLPSPFLRSVRHLRLSSPSFASPKELKHTGAGQLPGAGCHSQLTH
jgi:hypothetical protein